MIGLHASRYAARIAVLAFALLLALGAAQARDRTPPTRPGNLTVTGTTAHSVSLRWNPSSDNSGQFSYVICCANVSDEEVQGTASSHTYRNGLEAGSSFSLRIYAVDAAGNFSGPSNTVSGVLPYDVTPPTQPLVTVSRVGPTYVTLNWQSQDDGPRIWYTAFRDGTMFFSHTEAFGTAIPLQPQTSHAFTVRATDSAGNSSPFSAPVTVTTTPVDRNDRTPPTVPDNLSANGPFDEGEVWLSWNQSVDNVDPQDVIRYDIRVNGALESTLFGGGRQLFYLTERGSNTITVTAQDSAGNVSAPASITLQF